MRAAAFSGVLILTSLAGRQLQLGLFLNSQSHVCYGARNTSAAASRNASRSVVSTELLAGEVHTTDLFVLPRFLYSTPRSPKHMRAWVQSWCPGTFLYEVLP
jgi:hypothetical protein